MRGRAVRVRNRVAGVDRLGDRGLETLDRRTLREPVTLRTATTASMSSSSIVCRPYGIMVVPLSEPLLLDELTKFLDGEEVIVDPLL